MLSPAQMISMIFLFRDAEPSGFGVPLASFYRSTRRMKRARPRNISMTLIEEISAHFASGIIENICLPSYISADIYHDRAA